MHYEAIKGYGLQFTKADEQYQDTIIYRDSKEAIIRLADIIIGSFDKGSLLEELNNMQANSYTQDEDGTLKMPKTFESKFEIPSYFINLLLEKYNMKVLGW